MKKKISALLACIILVLSALFLFGCEKDLELTDADAERLLKNLIPRSHEINVILFGSGLRAVPEGYEEAHQSTAYFDVDPDCGYTSIQQIKTSAEQVYSKEYLKEIFIPLFEGVQKLDVDDGALDSSVSARYKEIGGKLKVDVSNEGVSIRGRADVISAWVIEKTPDYVKCKANCVFESGETFEAEYYLTYEDNLWVLYSPSY